MNLTATRNDAMVLRVKEIPLTQGKVALVDNEDYEYLSQFKWCAAKRGGCYYAIRKVRNGKRGGPFVLMHAELLGTPRRFDTDHKDRDGLNNQKNNLRVAARFQNNGNQGLSRRNKTGFKGVSMCKKSGKFYASICAPKSKSLGLWNSAEEAALAYDAAALRHFGEFAWLNFPL